MTSLHGTTLLTLLIFVVVLILINSSLKKLVNET